MSLVRLTTIFSLAISSVLFLPHAGADDRNIKFGARAGTLGYGAEVGIQLHKRLNVRGVMTGAEVNVIQEFEGLEYDATLQLGGSGVQLDLFPLLGGFYVSGGIFSNDNHVTAVVMPTEGITLGPTVYTPADVGRLDASIEVDDTATYLGAGWTGKVPFTMLEMYAEGGAYFQGEAIVRYEASGLLADDPNFLADLSAEADTVSEQLNQLGFYPAAHVGVRLRF